jgi:hypothetical protein
MSFPDKKTTPKKKKKEKKGEMPVFLFKCETKKEKKKVNKRNHLKGAEKD